MLGLSEIRWLDFQDASDERGRLTAIESGVQVPFAMARVFFVHEVAPGVDRGGHAHRDTDQVIVGVGGSLMVHASDGVESESYRLDQPARGLFVPRMTWVRLHDFSPGAICLVLANTHYDRSRSIRTWPEYLDARGLPLTDAVPGHGPAARHESGR